MKKTPKLVEIDKKALAQVTGGYLPRNPLGASPLYGRDNFTRVLGRESSDDEYLT